MTIDINTNKINYRFTENIIIPCNGVIDFYDTQLQIQFIDTLNIRLSNFDWYENIKSKKTKYNYIDPESDSDGTTLQTSNTVQTPIANNTDYESDSDDDMQVQTPIANNTYYESDSNDDLPYAVNQS